MILVQLQETNESWVPEYIRKWAARLGRLFATLVGVLTILSASTIFSSVNISNISNLGLLLIISSVFNIWLVVELILHARKKVIVTKKDEKPISALVNEARRLSDNGNYREVLRRRKNFSRLLWLEGKLKERIQLGKIAEDAAIQVDDKEEQIATLIDDLGWSLIVLGHYDKAKEHIHHGLEIAQDLNDHYWLAKAHRHLAGLHVERRELREAKTELTEALAEAEEILDDDIKREMIAGIEYGFAIVALFEKNPQKAKTHIDKSDDIRKSSEDESRLIRTYSVRGKISEMLGNTPRAKDYYRKGLKAAEAFGRRDEMIRNHLGLTRIYEREGDPEQASTHRAIAEEYQETTPVPHEIAGKELTLSK